MDFTRAALRIAAASVLAIAVAACGCSSAPDGKRTWQLAGTITWAGTATGVEGATVTASDGASVTVNCTTGSDGSYSLSFPGAALVLSIAHERAVPLSEAIPACVGSACPATTTVSRGLTRIYWVDPDAGLDTNDGAQATPLRTIGKAVSDSFPEWRRVQLVAGKSYGALETFPIAVRNQVELRGDPLNPTDYVVSYAGISRMFIRAADGISFTLRGLRVDHGAAAQFGQGTIEAMESSVTVEACQVASGGNALSVRSNGQLTVTDSAVTGANAGLDLYGEGMTGSETHTAILTRTTLTGGLVPLQYYATAGIAYVEFRDGKIGDSSLDGIIFSGGPRSTLLVRGTEISRQPTGGPAGVRIQSGTADLGTAGDPGENTFLGWGTNVMTTGGAGSGLIYAVGNTWEAPQPAGTKTGPAIDVIGSTTRANYSIAAGTSIVFSP